MSTGTPQHNRLEHLTLTPIQRDQVHPWPLRPGQRWPTEREREEAWAETRAQGSGGFPLGAGWEITEEHAQCWRQHLFAARRGDTNYARCLGELTRDEWMLFIGDLLCWLDRRDRGVEERSLAQYLLPGREAWGVLALAMRCVYGEDVPAEARERITALGWGGGDAG